MIASKAKQMAPAIEVGQLMSKAGFDRSLVSRVANQPIVKRIGDGMFEICVHILRGYWASVRFLGRNFN